VNSVLLCLRIASFQCGHAARKLKHFYTRECHCIAVTDAARAGRFVTSVWKEYQGVPLFMQSLVMVAQHWEILI
jgi:hypothetical protein